MTEPLQPPPRSLFEPLIRAALAEDLAGGVDVTSEATIPADLQGADASQATITAFNTYLSDKASSDTADASAQQALLVVTKNGSNPQVKSYIDGLLSKYYSYLSAN